MSVRIFRTFKTPAILLFTIVLTACGNQQQAEFYDPLEKTNRKTHALNKKFDKALLRPAGNAYAAVINDVDHEVINNFAGNLSEPSTVLNNILQGRLLKAGKTTLRFAVNSTLGFVGTVDVATDLGLDKDESDFGETLHVWGVGEGAYLELPFYGGSTTRDAVGIIVDFVTDPMDIVTPSDLKPVKTGARVIELIGDRDEYGEVIDGVLYETEDSYASQRLYYLQNRRFELNDGEISDADLENPYDVE